MLLKSNAQRTAHVRNINSPQLASEVSERQRLPFWPRLLAAGEPAARPGSPEPRYVIRVTSVPFLAPFG
jgi:hypothetical protein